MNNKLRVQLCVAMAVALMLAAVWDTRAHAQTPVRAYAVTFTAQTSVVIPGPDHQLGTPDILPVCWDTTAAPYRLIEPDAVTLDPVALTVTITFSNPQNGRCVLR